MEDRDGIAALEAPDQETAAAAAGVDGVDHDPRLAVFGQVQDDYLRFFWRWHWSIRIAFPR